MVFAMRAVLLTTNYPPVGGGVSRYNFDLVETAAPHIAVAGQDFLPPPPPGNRLLDRIRQIKWAHQVSRKLPRSTIILVSQPHLGLGVTAARREFSLFIHGGEWENFIGGQSILRLFARRAEVRIFNSNATMNRFAKGKNLSNSVVLRPGLPSSIPVQSPAKACHHESGADFKVICVGRLSPRKGHRKLISAVKRCRGNGLNVSLTCVGSGEYLSTLRSLVGPEDQIKFETDVDDVALMKFYDEAHLFVMVPEQIKGGEAWEGFGIVYLEAASRGLPIIATRTGGIEEATCESGRKLLAEDCSDIEISELISKLHEQPEVRKSMSLANLEWASKNSWASRKASIFKLVFHEEDSLLDHPNS